MPALPQRIPLDKLIDAVLQGQYTAASWFTTPVLWVTEPAERDGLDAPTQATVPPASPAVPSPPHPAPPLIIKVAKAALSAPDAPLSLGRAGLCDVVLPFDDISKVHARLRFGKEGWSIEDAGSTNGTWIGGEKLPPNAPRRLTLGDRVRFGGVEAVFHSPENLWSAIRETLDGLDQRRAGRLEVDFPCEVVGDGPALPGRAIELSMGGCRLALEQNPGPAGTLVLAVLRAPEPLGELALHAEVVRVHRRGEGWAAGLRFVSITPPEEEKLAKSIATLAAAKGTGQRQHPRVHKKMRVRCESQGSWEATLHNLSYGGVAIRCRAPVTVGSAIAITAEGPPGTSAASLSGKVVHVKPLPEGLFQVGVQFGALSETEREQLRATLERALLVSGR